MAFSSLGDFVNKENPIRVIDAFIDKLDLDLLGFVSKPPKPNKDFEQKPSKSNGRKTIHPKTLLKL